MPRPYPRVMTPRACRHCGTEYTGRAPRARYCSPNCAQRAGRERRTARRRDSPSEAAARVPSKPGVPKPRKLRRSSGRQVPGLTVAVLRELLRHLVEFRGAYEQDGTDTITGPDGERYSLWDIEALYCRRIELSPRQRQAIELCLVADLLERDVALRMGLTHGTQPVAMYATQGLAKLVG